MTIDGAALILRQLLVILMWRLAIPNLLPQEVLECLSQHLLVKQPPRLLRHSRNHVLEWAEFPAVV